LRKHHPYDVLPRLEGRISKIPSPNFVGFSKIYLGVEAICQTRISKYLPMPEPGSGYYDAENVYILVVDGLNTIHNARGKEAINSSLPSKEVL